MKKAELVKIWKQLDKACEAIEKLEEDRSIDVGSVDLSAIVSLKNRVEIMVEEKSRKGYELK